MLKPVWRNWQTRATQNRVPVRACGFDSHHRHKKRPDKTSGFFVAWTPLVSLGEAAGGVNAGGRVKTANHDNTPGLVTTKPGVLFS